MNEGAVTLVQWYGGAVVCLLAVGVYVLMFARSLLRALIGMELMTQGLLLLFILVGNLAGRLALAQSIVITLVVIEVAVIVVGVGVVASLFRHHESESSGVIRNLKG